MIVSVSLLPHLYALRNKIADTESQHTVCLLGSKNDGSDPYAANVALKWNLKLMGRNQALPDTTFGPLATTPTMFVGLDVTVSQSEDFVYGRC